jgi:putative membrane-bound dehydrogenase-like protein
MLRSSFSSVLVLSVILAATSPSTTWSQTSTVSARDQSLRQQPLSPQEALRTFEVSANCRIELAASEPEVIDPVTVRFDEQGRMWVVELRDYPVPPADAQSFASRIKVPSDLNRDGYFEHAQVFADNLPFPTGLQPFQEGVIVTLAGELVYLADTDRDGQCDQREVWFQGFSKDNEQLRANHPTWTIENEIHVASGLRGGEVQAVAPRWTTRSQPLSLATRDFSFSPFGGNWHAVAGNSQYGFYQDEWGRNYVCSNRNPCDLLLAETSQLASNPLTSLASWTVPMMPVAENSQVFPLTDAWTTSNLHAGTFTAACGVFRYESNLLMPELAGNFFACEPTGSLVQRYQTVSEGFVPITARADEQREFLASRDPWFRPVDLTDGPDGALYVVDMHRAVIEHPDWMPTELQSRADLRWGDQAGRIYRVVPVDRPTDYSVPFDFTTTQPTAWIPGLASSNRWVRSTAQRLLAQRLNLNGSTSNQQSSATDKSTNETTDAKLIHDLQQALLSANNLSLSESFAVRALWLLASKRALSDAHLEQLAQHSSPVVRRNLIRVIANYQRQESSLTHPNTLALCNRIQNNLANDASPAVRLQWLIEFAAHLPHHQTELAIQAAQPQGLSSTEKTWLPHAISLLSDDSALPFLSLHLARYSNDSQLLVPLLQRLGWQAHTAAIETVAQVTLPLSEATGLYEAFANGMVQRNIRWTEFLPKLNPETQQWLRSRLQHDLANALNPQVDVSLRQASLQRASLLPDAQTEAACRAILVDGIASLFPTAVQIARTNQYANIEQILLQHATTLPPQASVATIQAMAEHAPWTEALIVSLEQEAFPLNLIDPTTLGRLQRHPNKDIATRFQQLLAKQPMVDKSKLIETYTAALTDQTDLVQGKLLFTKHCAACHRIAEDGFRLGPDISDLRTQSSAQVLQAILDPNRAIDANYIRYSLLTIDGQVHEGLLEESNDRVVVLRGQEDKRITIEKGHVETLRASGVSLMPEGFENQLTPSQMNDLIGYIKRWRLQSTNIPL